MAPSRLYVNARLYWFTGRLVLTMIGKRFKSTITDEVFHVTGSSGKKADLQYSVSYIRSKTNKKDLYMTPKQLERLIGFNLIKEDK